MRRVRREHTAPEMRVRRLAHRLGLRFRLHRKNLPGSPDLSLPRHRTVIFVHGCFWHGHAGCKFATVPKTRTEWWLAKIDANRIRDGRAIERLTEIGWRTAIIWECQTRDPDALEDRLVELFNLGVDGSRRLSEGSMSEGPSDL